MTAQRLQSNLQKTIQRAQLTLTQPPYCPDLSLYLFDPEAMEGPLSHDEAQAVVAEPAYWSFCWASGQVLAHYILQHPECVEGKRVLDFGSGSGIVAIAAAKAGATEVIACDIDEQARDAIAVNAHQNGVAILCTDQLEGHGAIDLLTAADVLYDADNLPLLERFRELASDVLLADSRVKVLPVDYLNKLASYEARTWPDLNEFEEFNQVRIYSSAPAG